MTAPKIEIYSSWLCGYCYRAKLLLKSKNAAYLEHEVTFNPKLREDMRKRSGGRDTVPQIFIGGRHVGGCDELYRLEREGKLDRMLKAS